MSNPLVRHATDADRDALGRFGGALVRLHHAWDELRFMAPMPEVERGYGGFLVGQLEEESSVVLVAALPEAPDVCVGYAYGALHGRDWNMLLDAHGALHDIYVDASARRRGVARALVLGMCAELERMGAPRVLLHTAANNAEGHALFASLGFRTTMSEMTRERAGAYVAGEGGASDVNST